MLCCLVCSLSDEAQELSYFQYEMLQNVTTLGPLKKIKFSNNSQETSRITISEIWITRNLPYLKYNCQKYNATIYVIYSLT